MCRALHLQVQCFGQVYNHNLQTPATVVARVASVKDLQRPATESIITALIRVATDDASEAGWLHLANESGVWVLHGNDALEQ
jgi:hypothetical protein